MGHATAVAASLATLTVIREENLLDNVVRQGGTLLEGLREALGDHPNVGDIRGRGLFIGIEFVADRASKAPLDPAAKTHNWVQKAAFERGLMCYGMGGTIDGQLGDHVLLAPPYIIEDRHVAEIVDKFAAAAIATMPAV